MRIFVMRGAAILLPMLVGACASPDPTLFTLASTAGAIATGPRTIELRHIGIAGYLDRPGIVRAAGDYRLALAHNDRWGEPFGDLVQRVLTEDLQRRLPGSTVYADSGAISADPDRVLEVDVSRLNADDSGQVALTATVSIRTADSHAALLTRTIQLSASPAGAGTAAYVAALSDAVGQLADAIAAGLQSTAAAS